MQRSRQALAFLTVSLCFPKVLIPGLAEGPIKRKKILSPEELEERRQKRQEAAAKRKRLMEGRKKEKEAAEHRKKCVYSIPGWGPCCWWGRLV